VPAEPSEESAVDHYAENMRLAFSARDLEIVDDYLDGKIPRGLSRNSVQSRLSGLCTKAGIPALGNRGQFFQRVALLKAAREHMKSRVKRRAGE